MATVQHRSQEDLRDNYSTGRLVLQGFSIAAMLGFSTMLAFQLFRGLTGVRRALLLATFFAGGIAADFLSGMVHWTLDTWGTVDAPLIGPNLIRSFRVHHSDQTEITRHSFLRTAGTLGIPVIPVQIAALFIPGISPIAFAAKAFLAMLCGWTLVTNQAHKWAHMENPPAAARFFQRIGLFLEPGAHHQHHIEPFTQSYSITTGWTNSLLTKTQFFRRLERVIVKLTGAVPRMDDIGEAAAQEVLEKNL